MVPRKDMFNGRDQALTSIFKYSPAHVAVLHRRYDTLGFRRLELDEKRERARGGHFFGRERGAKASITGLVIAYGINSLATTLAASTFSPSLSCCDTGGSWARKSIGNWMGT